jgi:predicted O-methyltransferase YrrM
MIQLSELVQSNIGVGFLETGHGHLRLKTKEVPWSIVQKEFDYLYNIIVDNKLTRGYEACTGVGISALAAGLAMKQTGGKLVTLDAYIEEELNSPEYGGRKLINNESDGYKTVLAIIEHYQLQDVVTPVIGWTPDDVPAAVQQFTDSLDYVFIDGGHTAEQVIKDIEVLLPYTNEKTFWLFHDCDNTMWKQNVIDFCKEKLNKTLRIVLSRAEGCNNLGILE